ncbi:uncharacterized protein IL334_001195 [Kwoniella shivajii]|uniref:Uncharacterized protein n=1 Tax=Kwoniella shivajii TaxID=564305 RepID=A0ABZ1CSV6_9TREE|nr:hypothetical protein IL334_001195 [Kwoniella shivajii]
MLLDESRSRPLSSYPPSSAAFITFKDARTARLASKILDSHPKRSLACHTAPAPDWTDILWPRLGKNTYRSEFIRGWAVYLGVWAFTLVWAFLNAHPKAASAITSLAPVILVALLTIAILMVNGVVFFAPTAAPYFASYILLQVAIQPFFEIFRFGSFGYPETKVFSYRTSFFASSATTPLVIPFIVWKRQFTYVYGRLYETNGRRTSIRVLRYSLDALASDVSITRALKQRFKSLAIQEADILCPHLAVSGEDDVDTASEYSEGNDAADDFDQTDFKESSRINTLRRSVGRWAGSWKKTAIGRKPIPFDHVLFSTLDTKISFDQPDANGNGVASLQETRPPNGKIEAPDIVTTHPPLQPWEDIPPYNRSRGYNDQPTYTDDYDDFLWLPRDPLSTLDLDDTVEMRVTLTTSAGGSGHISDVSPEFDEMTVRTKNERDVWQGVVGEGSESGPPVSPGATSETRLVSMGSQIGSEVNDTFSGSHLLRRHTRKAATSLSQVFKRPRTESSSSETGISLHTISGAASPSPLVSPVHAEIESEFLTLARTSTPSAMSNHQVQEPNQDHEAVREAPTPSHISFAATLGRSPSGRRPARLRSGSSNMGEEYIHSPGRLHLSPQRSRTGSAMSAQQQQLLYEVIQEENLLSKAEQKEQQANQEKDLEELEKEKRRASENVEGGLRRRLTRGNSDNARPRLDIRRESERSRDEAVPMAEASS